jgi:hypothetical protein
MLAGIAIGITQNFVPAHAHLNLVGGVLLFLFGLYYRLVPPAGTSALAKVQGLTPYSRRHPVSGGRSRRAAEGAVRRGRPRCGLLIVVAAMLRFVVIVSGRRALDAPGRAFAYSDLYSAGRASRVHRHFLSLSMA